MYTGTKEVSNKACKKTETMYTEYISSASLIIFVKIKQKGAIAPKLFL
jgi:hypothetical protein